MRIAAVHIPAGAGTAACSLILVHAVLFDYIDFQIVEVYLLHKGVTCKPGPGVPLEISDCGVQPHRNGQVKLNTGRLQSPEDLVCPGIVGGILDHCILDEVVVRGFGRDAPGALAAGSGLSPRCPNPG